MIIEDDPDIRDLLEVVLRQAGFVTHAAGTGEEGVELVRTHDPLVATLDVSLPDIDGFEVARRIRAFSDAYVVMLTARADEIDTLMGLDAGADDYQTKPFRPRELRARIEAMLRRPRRAITASGSGAPPSLAPVVAPASPVQEADPGVISAGGLVIDVPARLVRVDGADVHLTRSEFDLLEGLASRIGRVVSKTELVRILWAEEYGTGTAVAEADRRSVEVHVANLRRKIGDSPSQPRWIHTVRGVGYRFAPTGA